jgi:hypothetical protein
MTQERSACDEFEELYEQMLEVLGDQVQTEKLRCTLDDLFTELECELCMHLFVKPVLLLCGHTFCLVCAWTWTRRHGTCPKCRRRVLSGKPATINKTLVNTMDALLATLDDDERLAYDRRRAELAKEERRLGHPANRNPIRNFANPGGIFDP